MNLPIGFGAQQCIEVMIGNKVFICPIWSVRPKFVGCAKEVLEINWNNWVDNQVVII